MDDRVALTITFTYLSTIVLVVAADAFIVSAALAHVLHVCPAGRRRCGSLALLAVGRGSNLRGVKVAGWLQDVATYRRAGRHLGGVGGGPGPAGTPLRTPF